ncbi:hypothetical protein [Inquilinus sp.]|jgi:hypothetical protein
MTAVLVAMWFQPDTRSQIRLSLASAAVVITAWGLRRAVFGPSTAPAE